MAVKLMRHLANKYNVTVHDLIWIIRKQFPDIPIFRKYNDGIHYVDISQEQKNRLKDFFSDNNLDDCYNTNPLVCNRTIVYSVNFTFDNDIWEKYDIEYLEMVLSAIYFPYFKNSLLEVKIESQNKFNLLVKANLHTYRLELPLQLDLNKRIISFLEEGKEIKDEENNII